MREVKQPSYFVWRGRHASENKAATWAGGLDTWLERDDGTAVLIKEGQAQPPAALEAEGFTLDDFMSAIAASAVRDMEAANAARDVAVTKREEAEEAKAAAVGEKTAALKAADDAMQLAATEKARADDLARRLAEAEAARSDAETRASDLDAALEAIAKGEAP